MSEQAPGKSAVNEIIFEILRFHPEKDKKPYLQEFKVPIRKGMTVLDGLTWIKENIDPTLAWRSSCRMGVCGSCAMFINGKPLLACNNQILHIDQKKLRIKPIPNFDIIKDLVPDLEPFFKKHSGVKPYLIRKLVDEQNKPTGEYFQSPEELNAYIQFAYCIKCGLCVSACPTCATDDRFPGPMALAQAWRYTSDSRDEGAKDRQHIYEGHGVWRCHFAGACSDACPKGVDPAMAVQMLKYDIFAKKLKRSNKKEGSELLPKTMEWKKNPDIPEAPEPTV
jgi:succinate dehydrogenase / fumarate reductase iron-sulfur subunit